jgi:hypothetical protein
MTSINTFQNLNVFSLELDINSGYNRKNINIETIKDISKYTKIISHENKDCSICLDEIKFCVQLRCKHIFCNECFISLWEYYTTKCPYCRQSFCVDNYGIMSKYVVTLPLLSIKDKLNLKLESENNKRLKSNKKEKPKRTRAEKRLLCDLNKSYCKN